MHRPSGETEPVTTTADHADIRGVAITLRVSVGYLSRSRGEDSSQPRHASAGCAITGAASPPRGGVAPGSSRSRPAPSVPREDRVRFGAHMKTANARAMEAADGVRVFAAREQLAIAAAEADLHLTVAHLREYPGIRRRSPLAYSLAVRPSVRTFVEDRVCQTSRPTT